MFIKYKSANTINQLGIRHLGVYELYVEAETKTGKVSETISTKTIIFKKHKDVYTLPLHTVDPFREYSVVELEASLHNMLNDAFKGNPYPDVTISYIAKTWAEYQHICSANSYICNELTMDNVIRNLANRIWVIRPTRKRKTSNPPILFVKRDNRYFVIDHTENDWTETEYSAKQIVAMADLSFGRAYDLAQIKI